MVLENVKLIEISHIPSYYAIQGEAIMWLIIFQQHQSLADIISQTASLSSGKQCHKSDKKISDESFNLKKKLSDIFLV